MFWDKHPANMYYSTSRRGSLNSSLLPTPEVASYESTAADWTCSKVRQPFDSNQYIIADGIDTDYTCRHTFNLTKLLPYLANVFCIENAGNLMPLYLNKWYGGGEEAAGDSAW